MSGAYLVKPVAYLVKQVIFSYNKQHHYAQSGEQRSGEWSNYAMEIGLLQSPKPCLKACLCLLVLVCGTILSAASD